MTVSARDSLLPFRRRWSSLQAREARLAWMLILPTALIVFGLVVFPAIFSIWISFRDVGLKNLNDVFHAPFVGLDNYRHVLSDFAFKWQGLQSMGAAVTSIVYSFSSTILTIIIGLIAALLLNRPFRARGLARAIFLFPYVAPHRQRGLRLALDSRSAPVWSAQRHSFEIGHDRVAQSVPGDARPGVAVGDRL